jgi:hypothetical protein
MARASWSLGYAMMNEVQGNLLIDNKGMQNWPNYTPPHHTYSSQALFDRSQHLVADRAAETHDSSLG